MTFWWRRDDLRPDARLWFVTIVGHGVPRLLLASFAFRGRRRDTRLLFSNFVSNFIPRINYAKFGVFLRRCFASWASVCQHRALWLPKLMFATDGISSRRRDNRGRDARRRFASVVSCGFPGVMNLKSTSRRQALRRLASISSVLFCALTKLMYAICGIFCQRLDGRCRFVSIESYGVSLLLLA
jgi:hypothetical protein